MSKPMTNSTLSEKVTFCPSATMFFLQVLLHALLCLIPMCVFIVHPPSLAIFDDLTCEERIWSG